ncbi:nucleotide pyrophosphohydrolase, partial [Pseudomonas monteilii]
MTTPTTSTQLVDITRLAQALERFASDRNWAQFHSPKNLVMALSGEVGELTEVFQWLSE